MKATKSSRFRVQYVSAGAKDRWVHVDVVCAASQNDFERLSVQDYEMTPVTMVKCCILSSKIVCASVTS